MRLAHTYSCTEGHFHEGNRSDGASCPEATRGTRRTVMVCAVCGRRVEQRWGLGRMEWRHLLTVAGKQAEVEHQAVPKAVRR